MEREVKMITKCARLSILLDVENKRRGSQKRPVTLVTGEMIMPLPKIGNMGWEE